MIPTTLLPIEVLESPYHALESTKKTRVQAFIDTDDLMRLKSFYPRKGVVDAVVSGLFKAFLQHVESLNLQAKPQNFHRNEQHFIKIIQQYAPGTEHTRVQYTLDEAGNPDLAVIPPR